MQHKIAHKKVDCSTLFSIMPHTTLHSIIVHSALLTTHHFAIAQWLITSYHITLHCSTPHHTITHYTGTHNTTQHHSVMHHIKPQMTTLNLTTSHHAISHYITPRCIKSYHLHCPTPHNIAYKCSDTMSHFSQEVRKIGRRFNCNEYFARLTVVCLYFHEWIVCTVANIGKQWQIF